MRNIKFLALGLALTSHAIAQAGDNEYKNTRKLFASLGLKYTNRVLADPAIETTTRNQKDYNNNEISAKLHGILIHEKAFTIAEIARLRQYVNNNEVRKDLNVAWINNEKGYGVFATADMEKHTPIGSYTGEVVHESTVTDNSYAFNSRFFYTQGKQDIINELQIDAAECGNITRFINHAPASSPERNCAILDVIDHSGIPHLLYLTTKNIKKGQELNTYYGNAYDWNQASQQKNTPATIISK